MPSSPKKREVFFRNNCKALASLFWKTFLFFCASTSTFCMISMYDVTGNINTVSSSQQGGKLFAVEKWRRASSSPSLPYTKYKQSYGKYGSEFWNSIQPAFKCPSNLLSKAGDVGDAGKWMCGLSTLGQLQQKEDDTAPCSVYTTGSKENVFFEVEVIALTKCRVFAYEPSAAIVDHPLRYFDDRVNLVSMLMGGEDNDQMKTLKTLMESNGGHEWVDVVKMDVGEGDLKALERILYDFGDSDVLPIGQLLVRIRVEDWEKDTGIGKRMLDVFEGLENKGLRLFYKEQSPFAGDKVGDFSFVNVRALERFLEDGVY